MKNKSILAKVIGTNNKVEYLGEYYPETQSFMAMLPENKALYNIPEEQVMELTAAQKKMYIEKTFVWGEIDKVYLIGDYQIIESTKRESQDKSFHAYVDFEDTRRGAETLDGALLICMAVKAGNADAAMYAARVLDI